MKLFLWSCLAVLFFITTNGNALDLRTEVMELRPPSNNAPPLQIDLPVGVKPQLEEMSDFSGYRCDFITKNESTPLATMTVYIGQNPPGLYDLANKNRFFQEVANFYHGRTAWFSWIVIEGKERIYFTTVYIYTIYTIYPNRDNPFVIQISIQGRDMNAVNTLKTAAQTIRPKKQTKED